jgi:hypothetical protein
MPRTRRPGLTRQYARLHALLDLPQGRSLDELCRGMGKRGNPLPPDTMHHYLALARKHFPIERIGQPGALRYRLPSDPANRSVAERVAILMLLHLSELSPEALKSLRHAIDALLAQTETAPETTTGG